jgi:hypothetical protein
VLKPLPSNAGVAGSIPGWEAKIPRALRPKNQNIKQKQYCNKFIKDLKIHISLSLEQVREDWSDLLGNCCHNSEHEKKVVCARLELMNMTKVDRMIDFLSGKFT